MPKTNPKQSPKPARRRPARRSGITINIPPGAGGSQDEREEEQEEMEEQEELSGDEFVDETEEALESVFMEARGHSGVEIRVYKLDPENRSGGRAYCMSVPLADAEGGRLLDTLQRKWKGGEFELMARANGRIVKRATINVLPLPEEPHPPAVQVREEISAVLRTAMEPMQQVVAELQKRPQMSFETILTKGAMLMPFLTQLRALIAPTAPPVTANDPMALLGQMKQMKDLMESMGLSDREPDGFDRMMTMFNQFGKPLLEKMEAAQKLNAGRVPVRRPVSPPTAGAAAPVAVTVPGAPVLLPENDVVAPAIPPAFEPLLPMLFAAAKSGQLPEEFADRVLNAMELLDDDTYYQVGVALQDGSLVSALMQKPELVGAESWLKAVAKEILDGLESAEAESSADGAVDVSQGNDGDTSGDAG